MQGMFRSVYFIIAGLLAALYLLSLIIAMIMMVQPLTRFSEENFSNPDDFPQQYAKSLIYIPLLHLIMSWSATFNGKMPVLSFALFMLSVLSVVILLGALSPHRTVEVERLEAEAKAEQVESMKEPVFLSPERKEEILRVIRLRMEDEQACLNSHLTLSKLSQLCGFNRTYVSSVLNESLGGFFSYVNRCRLEHARTYKQEHPEANVDEIASESGFNSRQSYYNACKKLLG
jgi:AraC-like DNA-binding protein